MKKLIVTLLIILSMSNAVYAESVGTIKGRVTVDGRAVQGAEVVIINEDMETTVALSNADGYYSFNGLPFGKYLITVRIDGKFYIKYTIRK